MKGSARTCLPSSPNGSRAESRFVVLVSDKFVRVLIAICRRLLLRLRDTCIRRARHILLHLRSSPLPIYFCSASLYSLNRVTCYALHPGLALVALQLGLLHFLLSAPNRPSVLCSSQRGVVSVEFVRLCILRISGDVQRPHMPHPALLAPSTSPRPGQTYKPGTQRLVTNFRVLHCCLCLFSWDSS